MMLDDSLRLCSNESIVPASPSTLFTFNPIGSTIDLQATGIASNFSQNTLDQEFGVFIKVTEAFDCVSPLGSKVTFCGFSLVASPTSTIDVVTGASKLVIGTSEPMIGTSLTTTPFRVLPSVNDELFFRINPPRLRAAAGTNPETSGSYYTPSLFPRYVGLVVWYAGTVLVPPGQDPSYFTLTAGAIDAWITDRVPTAPTAKRFADFNNS